MAFFRKKGSAETKSIRYTIFVYFTISAVIAITLIGITLYTRLSYRLSVNIQTENQSLISQVNRSMDFYLRTIMKLSDSLYYGVVKNSDMSSDLVNEEITLLYDNNKDSIDSIALFSKEGELLQSVPAARLKTAFDITGESWFQDTLNKTENLHFGMPQVRYIFENSENQYRWVVPMSRAVEITEGTSTNQGVLLIYFRYNSLEQLLQDVTLGNDGYIYLINGEGKLIYHPKIQLIESGLAEENNLTAATYQDGNHQEVYRGKRQTVTVKSVGYTGWKIVGVTPDTGLSLSGLKMKLFVVFIISFFLFILALINAYISSKITDPIKELEKSVNLLESGDLDAEVYTGGSYEIQHLGASIKNMAMRIQVLMKDIVVEHESKRKSEFDTLQSQINPHFLYNTLDIIVWMIENEKQSDAVKVVTALARFFRISLSKGKSIITLRDELEHVRNYLMIQQMRFKNKFTYEIEAPEDVLQLASLKLMLQPLVENAIYHGMEFMDGDGEIVVKAWQEQEKLYITIADNGLGMTEERVESLLTDTKHVASGRGSGIGVKNVNERIHLYFGEQYGLSIDSEPDEGTVITICLPAVDYSTIEEKEKR